MFLEFLTLKDNSFEPLDLSSDSDFFVFLGFVFLLPRLLELDLAVLLLLISVSSSI